MAFYPQLATGAAAQYPLAKTRRYRTTRNLSAEGRLIAVADSGGAAVDWELRYRGLTTAEWQSIETLFAQSEGRKGAFTFVDPADNLLAFSQDLLATPWSRDPLLQVTGGMADPAGGTAGFRLVNSGQTTQAIGQSMAGTGRFHYCFSVHLRSQSGGTVTLKQASASTVQSRVVAAGANWGRKFLSGSLGVDEWPLAFSMELAPGASVDVYGAQVDAQPAPGPYRKTLARSGVYESARFDQDEIGVVTEGPERHSLTVRITSRP